LGHRGEIWVEHLPDRFEGRARHLTRYARQASSENVLLAHFALVYSRTVMDWLQHIPDRKVLVYHNITPPVYFAGVNRALCESARVGREQLDVLRPLMDAGWGVSAYSARELEERGWARTGVLPVAFESHRYAARPDREVLRRYPDGLNVLFVGRVAPNKRFEDLILTFYHLKRYVRSDSRLLLVGTARGTEVYATYLRELVAKLGLSDVVFAGHVSAAELAAYYRSAHVYLSMSEHEGFGVPLLECMHFGVPVVAYKSTAVPETLGGAGMLITSKDHAAVAELIGLLAEDDELRAQVVARQRERLQDFSPERVQERLRQLLQDL
jgi:glycosyltransferase involved in cell wall biosynthesis